MPINTFVDGAVISASEHNSNWQLAVLTDTSRTITVTHTWSASQTFTGGFTAGAACTISTGGLTVTAGGLTVSAGTTAVQALTATSGAFGTTPASTGALRIPNGNFLNARNDTNGGDINVIGTVANEVSIGVGSTAVTFPVRVALLGAATAGSGSDVYLGGTTQTTIGANGAASALTAAPLGYLIAYKGSAKIVIPYYNG